MIGLEINFKYRHIKFFTNKKGLIFSFKSKYQIPYFMVIVEYYNTNKYGEISLEYAKHVF